MKEANTIFIIVSLTTKIILFILIGNKQYKATLTQKFKHYIF